MVLTAISIIFDKFAWNGLINLFFVTLNMLICSIYLLKGAQLRLKYITISIKPKLKFGVKVRNMCKVPGKKVFKSIHEYNKTFQKTCTIGVLIISIMYFFCLYTWYYADSDDAVRQIGFAGFVSDVFYIVTENMLAIFLTGFLLALRKLK